MEIINANYQCVRYLRYIGTCLRLSAIHYHEETQTYPSHLFSDPFRKYT